MLIYNFGNWTTWDEDWKVSFDPVRKLIVLNGSAESIDVEIDLYSVWKRWVTQHDNSKWLPAFRTFGGDATSESQSAPKYFFLINDWKIEATNVTCVVQTNLYSDDGLSPFIIENSAITNRTSDVPVVKSELEQRLDYGDRIYYDETSVYAGIDYPNGTIAQPVNNVIDAVGLAELYNIKDFYVLSNVTMGGMVNGTFENYSIIADRENLRVDLVDGNYMNNIDWSNFIINANFGGGYNKFTDCIIENAYDVSGQFKGCQIDGNIRIWDSVVMSLCYSGVAGSGTPHYDMNETRETKFSLRSYSGGVKLLNCNQVGDTTTLELIAGQVKLHESCTDGYIDLRGVGYLTDNSNGSTIKKTGFIDSFQTYIDETRETDERLNYGDRIYYDENALTTGSEYPFGTIAQPVNSIEDALTIANEYNITDFYVQSDLRLTGLTAGTFDSYEIYADRPSLKIDISHENNLIFQNMYFNGFDIIDLDFRGHSNKLEGCVIIGTVSNFSGHIKDTQIIGTIHQNGNTVISHCYSGVAGAGTPLFDMGEGITSTLSLRAYSGGVDLRNSDTPGSKTTIELIAGQIKLHESCTDGYIDLRGVGYITDNSNGSSVKTTGFIDSFEQYVEDSREINESNSYNNKLFLDTINGFTGSSYPIGTVAKPAKNIDELFQIGDNLNIKNIYVRSEFTINSLPYVIDYVNIYSDTPKVPVTIIDGSNLINVNLTDFEILDADFKNNTHYFTNCVIRSAYNLNGHLIACDLHGVDGDGDSVNIGDNATFVNCHPAQSSDPPIVNMTGVNGSKCSFRGWYGDLIIGSMSNVNDKVIIESAGSKITISDAATKGIIELRGVMEVVDNSGPDCSVIRDGQLQASPVNYNNQIVIDTINGGIGDRYPMGVEEEPVNNLRDALLLLQRYKLSKIKIIGSLSITNGENLSGITFTAERSNGNVLTITNAITNNTYLENLTCIINQNGSIRYTTSVLVDIKNFDGGAKDCLLITDLDIVGNGSNYLTNCDVYVTGTNSVCNIALNDKKLNIIRTRGSYNLTDKTSTDITSVDLVAGNVIVDSSCVSGVITIGGISEVVDNSSTGCDVRIKALSNASISDSVWDESINDHVTTGSTGDALNNISAGASPDLIAEAVWNSQLSGITASELLTSIKTTLDEDLERILGLSQQNYRLFDQVYNDDDLLTNSTIKIYRSATNCDTDTDPITTYFMTAGYDTNGRMMEYKVIEDE